MSRLDHLQGLERSAARRRMSREVVVPLLITAGLIGAPVAIAAWMMSDDDSDNNAQSATPPPTVDAGTVYPNNHYLAGAGYYHAPYHAWFPFPFNYHDNGRGWYRGGQWRPAAEADAVERAQPGASGFVANSGSGSGGTSAMSSRPSPEAAARANAGASSHASSVSRGGFGGSAHPSAS